jgi:hypothetical protein
MQPARQFHLTGMSDAGSWPAMNMNRLLAQCVAAFGPPPRTFSWRDRMTYLRVRGPRIRLMLCGDALNGLFRNLGSLLAEGSVVWGHIVQANELLFEPGRRNLPAEFVFSLEDRRRVDPRYLSELAMALFDLKGTQPAEPALRPIADHLTDEYQRVFGMPVPASISPGLRCEISTTYVERKHLPGGRLIDGLLPLIVSPRQPRYVIPLPARYWPQELVALWSE